MPSRIDGDSQPLTAMRRAPEVGADGLLDASGNGFLPYRHLAIRVLASALRDVSSPAASPSDRESARQFFAGSDMLFHWCRVAALDPLRIADHAANLVACEMCRAARNRESADRET